MSGPADANATKPFRILVIDDDPGIREAYTGILEPRASGNAHLDALERDLFGEDADPVEPTVDAPADGIPMRVCCASSGEEGLRLLERSLVERDPFDVAFVDMRMPPGMDGLETAEGLWARASDLNIVICTAESDHSWAEIAGRLRKASQLVLLRKPFDGSEVWQLAQTLCHKSRIETRFEQQLSDAQAARRALESAHHELERRAQEKATFVATTTHELRTPVNGILGLARMLEDSDLATGPAQIASQIIECAQDLALLVDDVLDYSKMEAGRMEIERVPFLTRRLLGGPVQALAVEARSRGLQVDLRTSEKLPMALAGDQVRIRQVIVNLLANAVKFTQRGEVELALALVEGSRGHSLRVLVRDTGIGIPADAQDRIFESYTQAQEDTTRRFGGTGLGLAIVKRLLALMGGTIEMESRVGVGTSFTCSIPVERTDELPPEASSCVPGIQERLRGRRVLLVEDDPVNRRIARGLLTRLGLKVEEAVDGETALRMASATAFDLVLMDGQLPGIDGFETARQLRGSDGPSSQSAVVALTGDAGEDLPERLEAAGMVGHVAKPILPERLLEAVLRWCTTQRDA